MARHGAVAAGVGWGVRGGRAGPGVAVAFVCGGRVGRAGIAISFEKNRKMAGLGEVDYTCPQVSLALAAEVAEWQTRRIQNPVPFKGVRVQVPPSAFDGGGR